MWTVVYVAQNVEEFNKVKNALTKDGILVKSRQIGKKKDNRGTFEILVPETEVDDASMVLTSITY